MTTILKKRISIAVTLTVTITSIVLGTLYSFWWLLLVVAFFYLCTWMYRRSLVKMRDGARFDTIQGKATITACNKRIEMLSGFDIMGNFIAWF